MSGAEETKVTTVWSLSLWNFKSGDTTKKKGHGPDTACCSVRGEPMHRTQEATVQGLVLPEGVTFVQVEMGLQTAAPGKYK